MIIDSHAYCFQPGTHSAGFSTPAEHLAWIQTAQGLHHQPAWRVNDRTPASSAGLGERHPNDSSNLPDVDFRIDNERGRVVWTIDGEDRSKQFYPPNLRNLEYTPHSLIAEMDYAGVDHALLHTNPMLGRDTTFLAECVQHYPDRLHSMAPVDEWRIIDETDETSTARHDPIKLSSAIAEAYRKYRGRRRRLPRVRIDPNSKSPSTAF